MNATMAIAAILGTVLAGCATTVPTVTGDQTTQRFVLADKNILLVDPNGGMRMFNIYGEPVYMKDGTSMQLQDGKVLVMKENVIWKSLRTRGRLGPRD